MTPCNTTCYGVAGAGSRWRDPHDWSRSVRIPDRVLALACTFLLVLVCALTLTAAAHARAVTWHRAGASLYGGPTDASSGCTGYRGFNLCAPGKWRSFAELRMGTALGGLPNGARIRILYRGRKLTVVKRDIGLGGGDVGGWPRSIDLWWKAARRLRVNGLAVVQWRRIT